MGDCDLCGINTVPIYLVEEKGSSNAMVKWKHFSMEQIVTKSGEENKKLKFVYKSIVSSELLEYLKPKFQFFVHHNFVARWQDMIKSYLENFLDDVVVFVVDFAENYNFEI
jgi:hypothetical protein